jgi:hypothetical protein
VTVTVNLGKITVSAGSTVDVALRLRVGASTIADGEFHAVLTCVSGSRTGNYSVSATFLYQKTNASAETLTVEVARGPASATAFTIGADGTANAFAGKAIMVQVP